ncbi:hypothetical protein MRX96_037711 [Rhipicephalus microplus]
MKNGQAMHNNGASGGFSSGLVVGDLLFAVVGAVCRRGEYLTKPLERLDVWISGHEDDGAMELRIGLDYVVEHPEYTRTLATAAASGNSDLRRQVWELLVALCVRGGEGTRRALSTLDQLATLRAQRTRLAALALAISRGTDDEVPPLLALANKALSGRDRARLRAELRARGSKRADGRQVRRVPPETLQQAWTALSTRASGSGKREAYLLRALQRLLADDAWDTPVRQTKHSQTSLEALDRCGTGPAATTAIPAKAVATTTAADTQTSTPTTVAVSSSPADSGGNNRRCCSCRCHESASAETKASTTRWTAQPRAL